MTKRKSILNTAFYAAFIAGWALIFAILISKPVPAAVNDMRCTNPDYWKDVDVTELMEPSVSYESLGTFRTTAYCNCKKCCGKWSGGPTASGAMPKAKHTIAVDTDVIPLGTVVQIDGVEYTAEDTGNGVNGHHIDIFFDSHEEALDWGVQKKEVFIVIQK